MSPWAKRILVASMLLWTALTAAAGWYALRGNGATASADGTLGTLDVAAPSGTRQVRGVTAAEAATIASSGAPVAASNATPPPATPAPKSLRPVPANAAPVGPAAIGGSLDPDGPRTAPAGQASKGVIVLDPGHGRGDPGAVHHASDGTVDITEADSNLHNAELIRDDLTALGYEVYLTRNGQGQGPSGPLPLQFITSDLYARVGLANAVDADLYLAIHGNGATVASISGPETWYCGHHDEGAANEKLARMVQQAMMDALHEYGYSPPDRGVKEDAESHHSGDFCEFVVTRETPVPAALLEFLFLTNDDDARVLLDDRAHVLMAQHVAAAIDTFMQQRNASP